MEHVYGPYNNNASSKVQIDKYFEDYLKSIASADCYLPTDKDETNIIEMMGVNLGDDEISMLSIYCSADNLTVEGEIPKIINNRRIRRKDVFDPQEPEDLDLQTIKYLRRRWKGKSKKRPSKYQSELFLNHSKAPITEDTVTAVPGEDILIFLRIYNPFKHHTKNSLETICGSKLVLNNVTAVLGNQTLADVRDKITCIADQTISKECSNDPDDAVGVMAKDIYKSGFFYIEDTFFNDTRLSTNFDYSKVIMDWAQRRPKLGPFKTSVMETCRIDTLCVRFGFPWVYKHQGSCEHLILFTDARLLNIDDELAVSAYPRMVRLSPKSSKLCMICGLYSVQFVTVDHDRIPHNTCFFCDSCFKSFNYVNGKKIGNFRAFAYPRNTELAKKAGLI